MKAKKAKYDKRLITERIIKLLGAAGEKGMNVREYYRCWDEVEETVVSATLELIDSGQVVVVQKGSRLRLADTVEPSVPELAARVCESLGAKAGTPELREAVKRFNEADVFEVTKTIKSDGRVTEVEAKAIRSRAPTGRQVYRCHYYPGLAWVLAIGVSRIDGHRAKVEGAKLLSESLGYEVKPEWIQVEWCAP